MVKWPNMRVIKSIQDHSMPFKFICCIAIQFASPRCYIQLRWFFPYMTKIFGFWSDCHVAILEFSAEWKVLVSSAGIQIGSPSPAYWAFGQPECSLNPSCDDSEASQQEASQLHRRPLICNPGYPAEHPQGVVSWGGIGTYLKVFSIF